MVTWVLTWVKTQKLRRSAVAHDKVLWGLMKKTPLYKRSYCRGKSCSALIMWKRPLSSWFHLINCNSMKLNSLWLISPRSYHLHILCSLAHSFWKPGTCWKKRFHTETILKVCVKQSLPTSVPVTERTFHGHMQGLALVLKSRKDDWTKFEILKEHYVNWFLSMAMTPSSPFHNVRDVTGKVFPWAQSIPPCMSRGVCWWRSWWSRGGGSLWPASSPRWDGPARRAWPSKTQCKIDRTDSV